MIDKFPIKARPAGHYVISVLGILLVVLFPFLDLRFISRIWPAFSEGRIVPSDLLSATMKVGASIILALLACGVQRRALSWFGFRRVRWRDLHAMLIAVVGMYAIIVPCKLIEARFAPSRGAGEGENELSLTMALIDAVLAGICEEFMYRGYLIEEFGLLVRSRKLAAGFSIVVFTVAHINSGYGWSLDLLYPGIFGLAATVLYLRTKNLWVCMLLHAGMDSLYAWAHSA